MKVNGPDQPGVLELTSRALQPLGLLALTHGPGRSHLPISAELTGVPPTPRPAQDPRSHSSLGGFWLPTACMWLSGMGLGWWPSGASAVNFLVGPPWGRLGVCGQAWGLEQGVRERGTREPGVRKCTWCVRQISASSSSLHCCVQHCRRKD